MSFGIGTGTRVGELEPDRQCQKDHQKIYLERFWMEVLIFLDVNLQLLQPICINPKTADSI